MTDEQILQSADPALCYNHSLQIAHDRMLMSPAEPGSEEYDRLWKEYLQAGGNGTMAEDGIDHDNYKRLLELKES